MFVDAMCQHPQIQPPYDGSGGAGEHRDNGQWDALSALMTTSETADDDEHQDVGLLVPKNLSVPMLNHTKM